MTKDQEQEMGRKIDYLARLLYQAAPDHPLFAGLPEEVLINLKSQVTNLPSYQPRTYLTDVRDFATALQLTRPGAPTMPPIDLSNRRLQRLLEGVKRLSKALPNYFSSDRWDPVAALGALVDLTYLTLGTAVTLGLDGVFPEAWRRVHAANLQKVKDTANRATEEFVGPSGWRHPDLSDLITRGFTIGNRNTGLYNLGVYLKCKYPDVWETRLNEFNLRCFDPPLPTNEVEGVIKSLGGKNVGMTERATAESGPVGPI
jgi:hypothetical protein